MSNKCVSFFGLGVLVFTGAFFGYLFIEPVIQDYMQRVPFDAVTWRQGDTLNNPIRIHMVDDLLRHTVVVGMSRAQIDDLLGSPSTTSKFKDYDYVYWLGPEPGLISVDSEWLVIRLKNGIVAEIKVVRD